MTARRVKLRAELEFPVLDEALVASLLPMAGALDDAASAGRDAAELRARFVELAGTPVELGDGHFSGACSADTFVRTALASTRVPAIAAGGLDDDELLELIRRVAECDGAAHEVDFWLALLEQRLPGISDLIFYPDLALAARGLEARRKDGDALSPREILTLARTQRRATSASDEAAR